MPPYNLFPVPYNLISGGQTGVDRAALDVALTIGLQCGGWCPAGRWAEDGPIHPRYPLRETPSGHPAQRTAWNVADAEATLVLVFGRVAGGTAWTVGCALSRRKPLLIVRFDDPAGPRRARCWLLENRFRSLNVAGPRESESPGIYRAAFRFLRKVLAR